VTPPVIILDLVKQVRALESELAPYMAVLGMTVREAIEILWSGFHDYEQMDMYIPNMIESVIESSNIVADNRVAIDNVYCALQSFALEVAYRLNANGLYDTKNRHIPHSWNWMPNGQVYLKYDKTIDAMLHEV